MTYYEKLGISKTATTEEIKEAYKALIKKYHPDVYQGDKSYAEKKTKEINVAYDILSDPIKKAEYDDEISPKQTTYTPPSYNYEYTPPKYDTPPSNYNDYRKSYSRDYNYNYRYTDYHRNKTPNSSYSENSPLENKIINAFDTNKLVTLIIIFIVYVAIFIFTFCQYFAFKNNTYTGPITNLKKVEETNTVTNNITNNYTNEDSNYFPNDYEDFDINHYISDSELYEIYSSSEFKDQFENFSSFKEALSKEFYEYFSELY